MELIRFPHEKALEGTYSKSANKPPSIFGSLDPSDMALSVKPWSQVLLKQDTRKWLNSLWLGSQDKPLLGRLAWAGYFLEVVAIYQG